MSIEEIIFGIVLVVVFGAACYIAKDARKRRLRGPGDGMGTTPHRHDVGDFGSDFGGGGGGGGGGGDGGGGGGVLF